MTPVNSCPEMVKNESCTGLVSVFLLPPKREQYDVGRPRALASHQLNPAIERRLSRMYPGHPGQRLEPTSAIQLLYSMEPAQISKRASLGSSCRRTTSQNRDTSKSGIRRILTGSCSCGQGIQGQYRSNSGLLRMRSWFLDTCFFPVAWCWLSPGPGLDTCIVQRSRARYRQSATLACTPLMTLVFAFFARPLKIKRQRKAEENTSFSSMSLARGCVAMDWISFHGLDALHTIDLGLGVLGTSQIACFFPQCLQHGKIRAGV
jgi:hypothetical protein